MEMEINFKDQLVGMTGYSSNHIDYDSLIRRIIILESGTVEDGDTTKDWEWQYDQVILLGDFDFNKEYLIESIEVGIANNFTCQYIALENFWDFYVGNFEPYFEGDERIENHNALTFLASLYEEYPEVDILCFGNKKQNNHIIWNTEHILRSEFGYSVKKGFSENERRNSLKNALKSNKLSIKEIADHIIFNINLRKGRKSMDKAVTRWLEDLEWLKIEFYDQSVHSFRFPQPN